MPIHYESEELSDIVDNPYLSALPVIATNWKQIPEFIREGETGFLIDYDLLQLIKRIKLLMSDERLLIDMKRNAFEYSSSFSSAKGLEVLSMALDKQKNNSSQ